MTAILNTSIITNFGSFKYEPIGLEQAKVLIEDGYKSFVGHQLTCDILTSLLNSKITISREQYSHGIGEVAIIFKLNGRPGEGVILTVAEIEAIGYQFGKLTRIE